MITNNWDGRVSFIWLDIVFYVNRDFLWRTVYEEINGIIVAFRLSVSSWNKELESQATI